jgi:hypothetical protein
MMKWPAKPDTDPGTDRAWAALCIALLLPMFAFPLGTDQSAFLRGGAVIAQGGILYVDFIDVKPPLIYLLSAISWFLFGWEQWGIRVLDILWQGATILSISAVTRAAGYDQWSRRIAMLLYALAIPALQFSQTFQPETFLALPLLWMLHLASQRTGTEGSFRIGALAGVMVMLKYTFGIAILAIGIVELLQRVPVRTLLNRSWRGAVGMAASMTVIIAVVGRTPEFYDEWSTVFAFTQQYASRPAWSLSLAWTTLEQTVLWTLRTGPVLLLAALWTSLKGKRSTLEMMSIALFVGMLFTVVLEKRFFPYHFARTFIPLVVLAAPALMLLIRRSRAYGSWVAIGVVVILLVASPALRWTNVMRLAATSVVDPRTFDAYLSRPGVPGLSYLDYHATTEYLRTRPDGAQTMVISAAATTILPAVARSEQSAFADAHFYLSAEPLPAAWVDRARAEIRRAQWLVVDTSDVLPSVTGHWRTSHSMLRSSPLFGEVYAAFAPDTTIGPLILLHRIP